MIRNMVEPIEQLFVDDWNYCPVVYEGTKESVLSDDQWMALIIAPIGTLSRGINSGCEQNVVEVQFACYGNDKVLAGNVADEAKTFFQASDIPRMRMNPTEALVHGTTEGGQFFYKIVTQVVLS